MGMPLVSYARHQFPPVVIQHAVWLYLRFTLSYRDVEDLLAERGLDISYKTVRRWVLKFGIRPGPVLVRSARLVGRRQGADQGALQVISDVPIAPIPATIDRLAALRSGH